MNSKLLLRRGTFNFLHNLRFTNINMRFCIKGFLSQNVTVVTLWSSRNEALLEHLFKSWAFRLFFNSTRWSTQLNYTKVFHQSINHPDWVGIVYGSMRFSFIYSLFINVAGCKASVSFAFNKYLLVLTTRYCFVFLLKSWFKYWL